MQLLAGGDAMPLCVTRRTGDSSARVRRKLWRQPPDILLTTPETLAVLLSQPAVGGLFQGVRRVAVDEVHSLAVNKRGADLALSLERLAHLIGERVDGASACPRPVRRRKSLPVFWSAPAVVAAWPW